MFLSLTSCHSSELLFKKKKKKRCLNKERELISVLMLLVLVFAFRWRLNHSSGMWVILNWFGCEVKGQQAQLQRRSKVNLISHVARIFFLWWLYIKLCMCSLMATEPRKVFYLGAVLTFLSSRLQLISGEARWPAQQAILGQNKGWM